jgi:molecular chaperone GrpE
MNRMKRQAPAQEAPDTQATQEAQTEETANSGPETPEQISDYGAAILALQVDLAQAQAQRDEYLNMAQRVQADFENFRRRNTSVRAEAYEDGAASFIRTILPVCDNLERALSVATGDDALVNGVRLVQKQLTDALDKRGVKVIDRVGQVFDPKLEDAVIQGSPDEGEPGTVAQVMQKGYQLGDSVLRHAMVKVIAG